MFPDTPVINTKAKPQTVQGKNDSLPGAMIDPLMGFQPFMWLNIPLSSDPIIPWSFYPSRRDKQLREMYITETIMAGAVYSLQAKMKALAWRIEAGRNTKKKWQDFFGQADDGRGWGELIGKTVLDLLTQDNGAFWELIGAGNPDGKLRGEIVDIAHIDAGQCWRTHDREYPVIYLNPMTGAFHKLHRTRVICMSSMTQPHELARGIGFCAVSRALKLMQVMRNVEIFKDEKISGNFRRAIIYGNGFTPKAFDAAMLASDETDDAKGRTIYRGIPVLLSMQEKATLQILDLASLPDGFDYEKDLTMYVYALALAFGVDARELWPSTQSGATKADASVQHLKASVKGIADLINTVERAINWFILPNGVEFKFDYTDDEADLLQEQISTAVLTNIESMLRMGIIDQRQAQAVAIYKGVLDPKSLVYLANPEQADDSAPMETASGIEVVLPPLPVPPNQPTNNGDNNNGNQNNQDNQNSDNPRQAGKSTGVDDYVKKYQDQLIKLMNDLIAHAITDPSVIQAEINKLYKAFIKLLPVELTAAFGVGLAGSQPTEDGISTLQDVGNTSADYFKTSFIPDLEATNIDNLDNDGIQVALSPFVARIAMYAGAYWQSMWEGQRDSTPNTLRVRRVLDPGAEHCNTCPGKEMVYNSYDDMVATAGIPGDGSDTCLSNCRCKIEVESSPGSGDFSSLVGMPTVFTVPLFEVIQ